MANEFLYKAVTNVGNLIYTAAREDTDGKPVTDVAFKTAQPVQLTGSSLAESTKTEVDEVGGVLTFSKVISEIEIYNSDPTNAGVFNVNGIDITIPVGAPPFLAKVGGTPRATVNVSGSTSYVVGRYE